jgi:carboxypeptidase Taq
MPSPLESLKSRLADVNALRTAATVLDWDQQTFMPAEAAEARAQHLGILTRMAHESFVDDATATLIEQAQPETEDDVALLRVVKRDFDLATKIPTALVGEKAHLAGLAHEEWVKARATNNFQSFIPTLTRMFEIARQEAEHLGYQDDIYDALLDQYEEGATAAEVVAMFDSIRGPQVELVQAIQAADPIDDSALYGEWSQTDQGEFTKRLLNAVGFDLTRGRQDTAPHPFCTNFSCDDIRLTTRYKDYLPSAIMGSMHEAGHGLYEQNSPKKWDLTLLAGGASLGLHESQSRTWENIVGRSQAFWNRWFPELKASFPALAIDNARDFYRQINRVRPSLIRVEADELTYNLHVMVRFEIEREILKGALAVKDLPDAWNAKYQAYLGVTPETDSVGCLQDVHWSQGSIGYFPTYSMGNLLSYQIWDTLKQEIPDVDAQMEAGDYSAILGWLTREIYSRARSQTPKDIIKAVTGRPIDPKPYLDGLSAKYRDLYGLG